MSKELVRTANCPVTLPMAPSVYSSWSAAVRLVKVWGRLVPRAMMMIPATDAVNSAQSQSSTSCPADTNIELPFNF